MNDILKIINDIVDIKQELNGEAYLKKLVENIAKNLDIKYVFIGHGIGLCNNQVQTDVVWANDSHIDNFIYDLKDTPCENVLTGKRVCIHSSNVSNLFPKDELLKQMGVESYVGAPVINSVKQAMGLLVLLDDKPMLNEEFYQSITDFLANRASTEIEKYRVEENLVKLVAQRTIELEDAKNEIEKINQNLEKRVKEEIEKNIQKRRIISEQSKMVIMGEMIDNIAHQFRQPLTLITTTASGIKMQKELGILEDRDFNEAMDSINETGQYLSSTIDDFRNFFNPSKTISFFNIKNTFEKVFRLLYSEFNSNNIEIIYEPISIEINGLENELLQVFMNILKNAKDELVKKQDERCLILIDTYTKDNELIIKIKDNAGGIKEENINKIFDYRFTTKAFSKGSGIGLFMSKQIIEDNIKGKLNVTNVEYIHENKSYKGAEFLISMKLK